MAISSPRKGAQATGLTLVRLLPVCRINRRTRHIRGGGAQQKCNRRRQSLYLPGNFLSLSVVPRGSIGGNPYQRLAHDGCFTASGAQFVPAHGVHSIIQHCTLSRVLQKGLCFLRHWAVFKNVTSTSLPLDFLNSEVTVGHIKRRYDNSDPPSFPAVQKNWDEILISLVKVSLQSSFSSDTDRARFSALQQHFSGSWLHAIPSPNIGTLMDPRSFKVSVAYIHKCVCGNIEDSYGHHALSCVMSKGHLSRHSSLNDIIKRALTSSGVPSILEPSGISRSDGKRPDGLTLVPWRVGKSLIWDSTCVYTLPHLSSTSKTPGSAAESAAVSQHHKYKHLEDNYTFVPFAVETFGSRCSEAKALISTIGRSLVQLSGDPRSSQYLRQGIGIAIQRVLYVDLASSYAAMYERSGVTCQVQYPEPQGVRVFLPLICPQRLDLGHRTAPRFTQPPIKLSTGSFPGVKGGQSVVPTTPPHSSAEVMESMGLYLHAPQVPSWHVTGIPLPYIIYYRNGFLETIIQEIQDK
ncbi:hypothetical protein ANN_22838 [Periplaneta americana]|uniref:Uncharacterized protein n=1 Tax=Periplaneta americana TaxID=6978 RepID=A0ABQ8SKP0_PERAM|nr:hypothetical protein ANN_22838 [Periplaneta americana]